MARAQNCEAGSPISGPSIRIIQTDGLYKISQPPSLHSPRSSARTPIGIGDPTRRPPSSRLKRRWPPPRYWLVPTFHDGFISKPTQAPRSRPNSKFSGGRNMIAYASRTLNAAEKTYSATELKCPVVIWSIRRMRDCLEGYLITVITDHQSLRGLQKLDASAETRKMSFWAPTVRHRNKISKGISESSRRRSVLTTDYRRRRYCSEVHLVSPATSRRAGNTEGISKLCDTWREVLSPYSTHPRF